MHTLFNFTNLRTKLSYLHRFFSFTVFFLCPDLHDTYKLIESCLIDSTDFENPLNYIFLWILSLVVKSHLFQFTFVLFLTGFFPVDIFDRYEMQMIQFKKNYNGKITDSFAFVHIFVMSHFIVINLYIIIFCYTFARNR